MRWMRQQSLWAMRFERPMRVTGAALETAAGLASAAVLTLSVLYIGFDHEPHEQVLLLRWIKVCRTIFAVYILYDLTLRYVTVMRKAHWLKWCVYALVMVSLLPALYPRPAHPWLPWLDDLLYSNRFLFAVLNLFAVTTLSYGMMRLIGRRANPTLILGGSFVLLIVLGTFLLMLPKCTVHGIGFVDSMFVSTSAVCITGLTPVDVPSTFTPLGTAVLAFLFQMGGMGIITFTCFFATFYSGRQSIYSQLLVKDLVYSRSLNNLVPTLLYVLGFTLAIEAMGAVGVYMTLPDDMYPDVGQRVWVSAFHAMSAFCNAGFSTIPDGMANPTLLYGNQGIYIVIGLLVFAGGIGFPILVNIKDGIVAPFKRWLGRMTRHQRPMRREHIFSLNTKLVAVTSVTVMVVGTVGFFVFERGGVLNGMDGWHRWVQSWFNSLTPRSSGFVSVNPALFANVTILLVLWQMWVGGSSQSMGGGIKVNTFATVVLSLKSLLRGQRNVSAFGRSIAVHSVRRANAIVLLSVLAYMVFLTVMLLLQPNMHTRDLVFETASALFTVGSSTGITASLTPAAKGVLCLAMFLGRVGLLSLLAGMLRRPTDKSRYYPCEDVIIN